MIGPERHLPVMSLSIIFFKFIQIQSLTHHSGISVERKDHPGHRDHIGQREFLNTSLLQLSF